MTGIATELQHPLDAVEVLEQGRKLCEPLLRAVVGTLAAPMDRVASYHFGWTDSNGRLTDGNGGKMLRPALALLSAEAVGAPLEFGSSGGAAVELVHNFSLIHDDFMDGDRTRRHRATAWTVFGPSVAVLTGDALLARASSLLMAGPGNARDRSRAAHRMARATSRLIDGQADDLAFEMRHEVTLEQCVDMVMGKTGSLLGCAASIGAVLAGADDTTADALERYGYHLGVAFQAADDLLGIWGDPQVTGKPAWGDLRRRKKSLPVCAALADGGKASRELAAFYSAASAGAEEEGHHVDELALARYAYLVEAAGGRAWALAESRRRSEEAVNALDRVSMPAGVRRSLQRLVTFAAERSA
ncbi:polyprenyl synthetase family protein [Streptomyces sp. NPDC087908]|uniref:polyprenyl synthetase family protein n=1 Tax=Streptomyces sp. NPDC087908 TaxID=3365820 RepID=UPI0038194C7D